MRLNNNFKGKSKTYQLYCVLNYKFLIDLTSKRGLRKQFEQLKPIAMFNLISTSHQRQK